MGDKQLTNSDRPADSSSAGRLKMALHASTAVQRSTGAPVFAQAAAHRHAVKGQAGEVVNALLAQLQRQPAVHHRIHGLLPRVSQVRLQAAGRRGRAGRAGGVRWRHVSVGTHPPCLQCCKT